MKKPLLLFVAVMLGACAAAPEDNDPPDEQSAIEDFIAVAELPTVSSIRSLTQFDSKTVNEWYVIISTRKQDYLLEHFTRCTKGFDGHVEPDIRRDSRAIYAGSDTYRGCRIKAIYALEPAQVDEVRAIAKAAGR